MKFQYMSDLHLDFEGFMPINAGADVLILAGDIAEGGPSDAWMLACMEEFPYVIYITGNHEYYHNDMVHIDSRWLKFETDHSGFFFLNPGHIMLEGIDIVGGCWWTDFWGNKNNETFHVANGMNDYRIIQKNKLTLIPYDTWGINVFTTKYFENYRPHLVITHHGPTLQSINYNRGTDRLLDPGYVSKAEELVYKMHPRYWIHGHTHHNVDYMVDTTHVLSNCKGYWNENKEFKRSAIIEINRNAQTS